MGTDTHHTHDCDNKSQVGKSTPPMVTKAADNHNHHERRGCTTDPRQEVVDRQMGPMTVPKHKGVSSNATR